MERMQSREGFSYFGERRGWLIAATQAPDWGDALQRSNFRSMLARLGGESDDVAVEYAGGAFGSIDFLLVRPGSTAATEAERLTSKLEDYQVVDEDDLSNLEWCEEWCVRCKSATREQHPTTRCGKFRSEEDAAEIVTRWSSRGYEF